MDKLTNIFRIATCSFFVCNWRNIYQCSGLDFEVIYSLFLFFLLQNWFPKSTGAIGCFIIFTFLRHQFLRHLKKNKLIMLTAYLSRFMVTKKRRNVKTTVLWSTLFTYLITLNKHATLQNFVNYFEKVIQITNIKYTYLT